ncbi:MAG: cache domain-containing protein [Pseudomonadota bacterium]
MYTIYGAIKTSDKVLDKYKQEEIYDIKQNLKNFVDVAYSTIDSNYKNSMDKKYLEKHYGDRLRNIIDVAETILKSNAQEVKDGKLTLAEAQAKAIEAIQKSRYDNGRGYIWINDTTLPYPKTIMHPTIPSLNGQTMDDPKYNCAMGKEKNLFVAFVEVAQKPGGGFVDYLWPRTTQNGLTTDVPKLSYVRRFPAWNWIIGTDLYINDAILDGMEKSKEELRQMRYDNGIGFFWINNTDESSPKFYMYPIAASIENMVLAGGNLDKLGAVIKSFINICKDKGSGYIEYTWDKPTLKGTIKDVPKLSYVKLYEPLGWIIGTGVYLDDIDKVIDRERKFINQQIRQLIINILVASIVFILFISILHYVVGQTSLKAKPMAEETPTTIQKTEPQQQAVISVNESLKFAKEISKIILAEQTKLLAFTVALRTSQGGKVAKDFEMTDEVEELADQVSQTFADVKAKTIEKSTQ